MPCPDTTPLGPVLSAERLHGGLISGTFRLRCRDGTCILKTGAGLPHDLYAVEAASLDALRLPGCPAVPAVLGHGPDWLLLEDFGPQPAWDALPQPADDPFWEEYGRALARLHGRLYSRCGWERDTYWGTMRMDNRWCADGHVFYAEQRFRWFLRRPAIRRLVPDGERAAVDRVAGRLPLLVPAQAACLNHGDLWAGNRAVAPDGRPGMLDPFLHAGWASCDLHNCLQYGGFPERFFAAYREVRWLPPDWRHHSAVFFLLHHLGLIDQGFGDDETWRDFRALLARLS